MEKVVCPICHGTSCACVICNGTGMVIGYTGHEENKKRNQKSQKYAKCSKKEYRKGDLDIIMDYEHYSAKEAAYITGRSIKAVETMRYRVRKGFIKYEKRQK